MHFCIFAKTQNFDGRENNGENHLILCVFAKIFANIIQIFANYTTFFILPRAFAPVFFAKKSTVQKISLFQHIFSSNFRKTQMICVEIFEKMKKREFSIQHSAADGRQVDKHIERCIESRRDVQKGGKYSTAYCR